MARTAVDCSTTTPFRGVGAHNNRVEVKSRVSQMVRHLRGAYAHCIQSVAASIINILFVSSTLFVFDENLDCI